jgi:hypothetical protein
MGLFALLAAPVLLVMQLLSGGATPMESMPVWLQHVMRIISPTPHFAAFRRLFSIAAPTLRSFGPCSSPWPR